MAVLVALAAALFYIVGSLVLGDSYPFSKHSMYASTALRDKGAVPLMLADRKPVEVDELERFQGLDPDALYPHGLPCSLEWQVHEAGRWIRNHTAPPGDAPGPVTVSWGFVIVRVDKSGKIYEKWRPVQEGTAWRRS